MYQYLASVLTVLLPQVLPGNLLPDAVSWFFTSVLKGLQVHGQHDGCMAALVHLAFQIYEALVRNPVLHPSVRLRNVRGMVKTVIPCPVGRGRGVKGPKESKAVAQAELC